MDTQDSAIFDLWSLTTCVDNAAVQVVDTGHLTSFLVLGHY